MTLLSDVLEKEIILKEGYINFWRDSACKEPKNEVEFQPYIANTLDNFCKVNGIQLNREVKEANGSVDILFSFTTTDREILKVCVEIKKAHHQNITTAISTQLPLYMKSVGTDAGIYLVIWQKNSHHKLPNKYQNESELKLEIDKNNPTKNGIEVKIINCCKQISPSKL